MKVDLADYPTHTHTYGDRPDYPTRTYEDRSGYITRTYEDRPDYRATEIISPLEYVNYEAETNNVPVPVPVPIEQSEMGGVASLRRLRRSSWVAIKNVIHRVNVLKKPAGSVRVTRGDNIHAAPIYVNQPSVISGISRPPVNTGRLVRTNYDHLYTTRECKMRQKELW